jgi:hypothetical protein
VRAGVFESGFRNEGPIFQQFLNECGRGCATQQKQDNYATICECEIENLVTCQNWLCGRCVWGVGSVWMVARLEKIMESESGKSIFTCDFFGNFRAGRRATTIITS